MLHLFYFGRINRDILGLSSLLALKKIVNVLCTPYSLTNAYELKIFKDNQEYFFTNSLTSMFYFPLYVLNCVTI